MRNVKAVMSMCSPTATKALTRKPPGLDGLREFRCAADSEHGRLGDGNSRNVVQDWRRRAREPCVCRASFVALQNVELGLDPENILHARLPLPREQYKTAAAKRRFFQALQERLHRIPGVLAAAETSTLPPYGGIPTEVNIPGLTHSEKWEAMFRLCSEGYFPTLRLKLLRGRILSAAEVDDARKVAAINQTLARKFFGKADPIGQRIEVKTLETWPDPMKDPIFEVVGIVADAKNRGLQEPPMPEMFLPYTITGFAERGILVRTAGDPLHMVNALQKAIWATDRNVGLTLIGSLHDTMRRISYAAPRFGLMLLGVFASVGLILVAIGVFSVMAYAVSRQTHEIGLRMALGARPGDVLRMVLARGAWLLGIGTVAGLLLSLAATTADCEPDLGCFTIRSGHVDRGGSGAGSGRRRRLLFPEPEGHARRPHDCSALRVARSRGRPAPANPR